VTLAPSTATQSGDPGRTVTYTLRITNTGNAADTFMLSKGSTVWMTDVPGSVGPLAAGVGTDVEVVVHIPSGASGGATDVVSITATSQGDGSKTAGATLTTTANAVRGVTLTPSTAGQTGDPGETVTYTLRITNTGNVADTFTLSKGSTAWTTEVPGSVGPLAAGAGVDVEVVVHIPSGASGGATDVVSITATSQGDGSKSISTVLTTTISTHKVFLPLVLRN
jgi:uncharacterized membrane protein